MIAYAPLVGELDQQVEGVLTRQVLEYVAADSLRRKSHFREATTCII